MSDRKLRLWLAAPLALLAALAFASTAQAFGLSGLVSKPAVTDAGAHSAFRTHLDVTSPGDQLRDLTVSLPPGVSGNPQSAPKCTVAQLNADACPSGSQIGTTTNQVTAAGLIPLTVKGSVYNVAPRPGEPARLGIVLRPDVGEKIIQQVEVRLRPDYGLDTILTDLPRNAVIGGPTSVPIAIDSIDLRLNGSFMSNPTSCGTQTTRFSARSWKMGAGDPDATGTASYASTACRRQPYDPRASLDIDGDGQKLLRQVHPTVTSVITQSAGQANNRSAAVLLPYGLGVDAGNLADSCAPADFRAGSCAAATQVGNATVVSPLLPSRLAGPVYLVTGATLPLIGVDLKGPLPLKIIGTSGFGKDTRVLTTFDGLPDLPLSRFELTFPGGPDGIVVVSRGICSPGQTLDADFTSQAGQSVHRSVAPVTHGCEGVGGGEPGTARKPKARIRVRGARHRHPRVSMRVRSRGPRMRRVRVRLPKVLKLDRRARHAIVVRADGRRIRGHRRLFARGRVLKVRSLPRRGAKVLKVRIRARAFRHPRRVGKGRKMKFRIKVARRGQRPAHLKVRTRARR